VNKGRTRKGAEFVRADFSDNTGQFSAACFEEGLVDSFVKWAREGTCILLTVELDSPSPEEPPRVTVRGARPLAEVKESARMVLTLDIASIDAVQELAMMLVPGAPGRGEVQANLQLGDQARKVRLGSDFVLDGELVDRIAEIAGVANAALKAKSGPSLRLVA